MDPNPYLPDHLLIMIVSFLTFREAVRTSVLSRNWQNAWRGSRNVELDERFFSYIGEEGARRTEFINLVRNWMENYHEPTVLDKLRVVVARPVDFLLLMEQCIEVAVRRGVKVLGLDFSDPTWGDEVLLGNPRPDPAFVLPQFINEHRPLESLTLASCTFNVAEIVNFQSLNHLSLSWIELPLPTLSVLLENLPLLESLSLKNCWNIDGLQIRGQNLRLAGLVIEKFIMSENPWIEIGAPNLKHFKYSGTMAVFDIGAGALEEASFEFGLEPEGDPAMGDRLYQLLNQLRARKLTVCTYMLQVLPHELESNGVASVLGVGQLTLNTAMLSCEQKGIQYLLRSCPFMMALIIQIVPERIVDVDGGELEVAGDIWTNAPEYFCVMKTLKVVQVRGYRGTRHEVGFLKYIICRARVIENLHILISEELQIQRSMHENRLLIARTFQGLRRASNNLRISVYGR